MIYKYIPTYILIMKNKTKAILIFKKLKENII